MIDIKQIAESLIPSQETILTQICPGGTISGREYQAGAITGGPGKSFSFNLQTGKWADFATGEKGGDIISLYAQVNRINNAEAARILQEQFMNISAKPQHHYPVKTVVDITIIKPPRHAVKPEKPLNKGQEPSYSWTYRDVDSEPLFYIFRYDMPDGTKTFTPLSFSSTGQWVKKQWPAPRPLYNLDKLTANPNKPVLIVEGEKAADAAEKMQDIYIVTTWPGGVNAINKTDFSPLYNRKLLLWPDGDQPGIKGMAQLAALLREHAIEIKIINPDRNSGWDAYDAFTGGMDKSAFITWAKPLVTVIEKQDPPPRSVEAEVMGEPKPSGDFVTYMELGLTPISEKNPRPYPNESNAAKLLAYLPQYSKRIWFDIFYKEIMTDHTTGVSRKWEASEDIKILCHLQDQWDMPGLSLSAVERAISMVAMKDQRNELADWLNSLSWDQQPRINNFLNHAFSTPDSPLTQALSANWLKSLVARGVNPGCKVDTMLVLKGKQGTFKSTALKYLAGKYFAELNCDLNNDRDFPLSISGRWIVELDELHSFNRVESTTIKKRLSQAVDNTKVPYGKKYEDYPRTCVMVGTTNAERFSHDETGNRRFWPVDVFKVDLDYIKINREQLFAEALFRVKQGESWHEISDEILELQDSIRVADPYEEMIDLYLSRHFKNNQIEIENVVTDYGPPIKTVNTYPMTVQNISRFALGFERMDLVAKESRRVAKAMRGLGFLTKKTKINNTSVMVFYKDDYLTSKSTEILVAENAQ
jgi:hypothetical protein